MLTTQPAAERVFGWQEEYMPGTGVGIFWIDFLCRPAFKSLLLNPEIVLLGLFLVYSCVAYRCLKSAYLADRY